MQIQPKAESSLVQPTGAKTETMQSARDRAIAMLVAKPSESTAQEHPVSNPNRVSPEELTAVKSASKSTEAVEPGQKYKDEPVQDESAPEVTKSEAKEDPLSTQYAILARKEKALRMKSQELRAKEDAFKAQETAAQAAKTRELNSQSETSLRDRLTKDPMSVLNELGITYDQLVSQALDQPNPEQLAFRKLETEMRAEIKALKDAQDGAKKNFDAQQQQSYEQAVSQIRNEAKQLVSTNSEFEMIKDTNSVNDVVDLIEKTFKADGILLTVEDAAREVENYLTDEAMKIVKSNKIQQRLQQSAKSDALKQQSPSKQSQTMKTLTNAVSNSRPLTPKERAILAFKGELKS